MSVCSLTPKHTVMFMMDNGAVPQCAYMLQFSLWICFVEISSTFLSLTHTHTHTRTPPFSLPLSLSLSLPSLFLSLHTQRSDALEQLQRELEALKNRLRGDEENRQRDHDASQAAKDAIIDQLRRELHDTQARLNEAENKIVELTTSKAAEIVSQCDSVDALYTDHLRSYLLKFFGT